jgi:hypothetical protein
MILSTYLDVRTVWMTTHDFFLSTYLDVRTIWMTTHDSFFLSTYSDVRMVCLAITRSKCCGQEGKDLITKYHLSKILI